MYCNININKSARKMFFFTNKYIIEKRVILEGQINVVRFIIWHSIEKKIIEISEFRKINSKSKFIFTNACNFDCKVLFIDNKSRF